MFADKRRRSLLQTELILELDNLPAKTITELAIRVNAMRPSVSRSLKILQEDKILIKHNGEWQLTDHGIKEARLAKKVLSETTEKMRVIVTQTNNSLMENTKKMLSISDFQFSILNSPTVRMIEEISKNQLATLNNIGLDFGKVIDSFSISPDILKLNSAIEPLLKTQELNTQFVRDILSMPSFTGLEEIVKTSNFQLASAISNTLAIRQSGLIDSIRTSIDFDRLFTQLVNVNSAHEKIFNQYVEQIKSSMVPYTSFDLVTNVGLPIRAIASYTISIRDLFDAEAENFSEPLIQYDDDYLGDKTLDIHLSKLDSNLVEMRRGSWLTLKSNGPDYLRQSAVSQRELLRQVLEILVPSNLLPNENRQGPQIKARAKMALGLGDKDAEFVDACAKAVLIYYEELNKYTHTNEKHEESLKAILHTGEGLIRFILTKANFYSP